MRSPMFILGLALAGLPAVASAASVVMHRDPGCGCCEKWAAQVRRQFARDVRIVDDAGRAAYARTLRVPPGLSSCHTAVIDGLAFEGHVPLADMKRALAERPRGVSGLAVRECRSARPAWRFREHRHNPSTRWRSAPPDSASMSATAAEGRGASDRKKRLAPAVDAL